jgi:hypothetical protein
MGLLLAQSAHAAYVVKQTKDFDKTNVESVEFIDKKISKKIILKSIQESIAEGQFVEPILYQEIMYPDHAISDELKEMAHTGQKEIVNFPNAEVKTIVESGPDNNRINITILGDGYTLAEKQKYYDDVNRMVNDLFKEVTFKSYLPLFNIYAVFVPSKDSGITDTVNRTTAFDLYRSPRNSKRGVMPGNRSAIEKAIKLVDAYTDYPIIIANDDYYGGLGGRYAITTRSLDSGSMVLRHELGHNFSNVGEEYDGGQVYSGANFSSSKNVPWKHWIKGNQVAVHEGKFLTGAYLWQDLGKKDYVEKFEFPAKGEHSFDLKISSVGWASKDDVKVYLDGDELELNGVFTKDRSFFRTKRVKIANGKHELKIVDHNRDGDNVLAFANGYAYPKSFDFSHGKVGAFNVFDNNQRQRGYRPTENLCLMRDMRSKVFCSVDQENIWIRFLGRISLIDSLKEKSGKYELKTLDLKGLSIKWFKQKGWSGKTELAELAGQRVVDLKALGKGTYIAQVTYSTPEIRKQTDTTTDTKEVKVK